MILCDEFHGWTVGLMSVLGPPWEGVEKPWVWFPAATVHPCAPLSLAGLGLLARVAPQSAVRGPHPAGVVLSCTGLCTQLVVTQPNPLRVFAGAQSSAIACCTTDTELSHFGVTIEQRRKSK